MVRIFGSHPKDQSSSLCGGTHWFWAEVTLDGSGCRLQTCRCLTSTADRLRLSGVLLPPPSMPFRPTTLTAQGTKRRVVEWSCESSSLSLCETSGPWLDLLHVRCPLLGSASHGLPRAASATRVVLRSPAHVGRLSLRARQSTPHRPRDVARLLLLRLLSSHCAELPLTLFRLLG